MKLKDKVAVVTGGARDIGGAISRKLAAEGAKVAINYFGSELEAQKTLLDIENQGGRGLIVQGDMTKQADVTNLVASARAAFGPRIDILVNVTGGMVARKTLTEMDEEFFDRVIRLNLHSTFLSMKAVVPRMSEGGAIVNLASLAGRDGGGPGASAYSTSKAAVMTLTRAMAKELGPKGIRVNALCPGLIGTSFHDTFSNEEGRARIAGNTPLRREGMPEEVADAAVYLASDEASFITGANIDINGGLWFS